MGVLKREATNEQARALVVQLKLAESELAMVICHTRGLTLREADKLHAMCERLRSLRYAIEIERRFEWREGSGWWVWNDALKEWELEPAGREPRRAVRRASG